MLQAADNELQATVVFDAFCELCFETEADIDLVEVAALRGGFERFDFKVPSRRDVIKLKRQAAFRNPGFFLTADHSVAHERKTPIAAVNTASLLAKPVDFDAVRALMVARFGEPNRHDLAGVGISFASIAGSADRSATYYDANARHEAGEGDLVVINLNDIRTKVHVPSDAIAMNYTRWIR
ncbi:hypothetical protein [Terricaulis silvestris]|uniref:hypothetical protein n=1 Tax=Terricaulis silvestris TaxID=2686094 RepID=UPI00131D501F|nr:hypothetical protein [Terricaulis silvestris]